MVQLPHPDYRLYNKASGARLYAEPSHAIFWRDDGDAVLTFKKNGPWYLHGVGGAPYFGREGLTWQLVAARIKARYLPPGYVLDSGAPCAFLRPDVSNDGLLYFILAWLQTELRDPAAEERHQPHAEHSGQGRRASPVPPLGVRSGQGARRQADA